MSCALKDEKEILEEPLRLVSRLCLVYKCDLRAVGFPCLHNCQPIVAKLLTFSVHRVLDTLLRALCEVSHSIFTVALRSKFSYCICFIDEEIETQVDKSPV